MSQNKVEDVYMIENNNRIQTRRASRSARSASPVMEEEVSSPVSSVELDQNTGSQVINNSLVSNGGRVTRSQSVESSGYETTDSRKRKRKAKNSSPSNKKRAGGTNELLSKATPPPVATGSPTTAATAATPMNTNANNFNAEGERETRNTAQRISKEAREAKKAQRDLIMKERLTELDNLEKAVKDGSHFEYHKLLSDIESKRSKMLSVAEMRRSFAEGNVNNFFNAQKYAAYSQYYWDKLTLRRSMIQHVQQKINTLEQEYYSNHVQSSLDDDHLTEWVPPDRPSMINILFNHFKPTFFLYESIYLPLTDTIRSLTLGLAEDDIENDVEQAKQDPATDEPIYSTPNALNQQQHHPNKQHQLFSPSTTYFRHDTPPTRSTRDSPPLDMLASLVDHRHPKEEPSEKSFTLPPLNPWRYKQRPTLPT
ncbi:hypothetical protein [Parasitella parasitica]|uniref:Uncharacterized protein n=1 Tax=Parasitella parasitica TaxID=35722 RepID=A0A0B7NC60_9FUNG|nr:hypothetical protein [Parasitella parasitica]